MVNQSTPLSEKTGSSGWYLHSLNRQDGTEEKPVRDTRHCPCRPTIERTHDGRARHASPTTHPFASCMHHQGRQASGSAQHMSGQAMILAGSTTELRVDYFSHESPRDGHHKRIPLKANDTGPGAAGAQPESLARLCCCSIGSQFLVPC